MDPATPSTEPFSAISAPFGFGLRLSGGRLLTVAGLCAMAIAQPTLDLLGGSPSTFQVNRIVGYDIALFAVAIVAFPPAVLWLVGEVVGRIHGRAGQIWHVAVVGLLSAMFGVLASKEFTGNTMVNAISGLLVGGLVAWAHVRTDAVRSWLRVLSVANLLFLAQFVFISPVSDWIGRATQQVIVLDETFDEPPPSVVMIVFDEWPTQSILDVDEQVDPVRFPNLAAFASESTWYRHFTAVSPFTQSAVPALLDGIDPHGQPIWNDHPENLFGLLAGTHHLTVAESITQLCGFDICGVRPVPPPATVGTAADPAPSAISTEPRWSDLLASTREIWTERVTPGVAEPRQSFDDFAEELDVVDAPQGPDAIDANAGLSDDQIALERFFSTLVDAQPDRQQLFVDALQPTDEPFFAFLHLVLPHQPWTLREDGKTYDVAAGRLDFDDHDDPWPVAVTQQRHLLQAEYADRLLGVVLDRLQRIGEYDDSLIVVVSDHGAAFSPGEPTRRVTDGNIEQITYAPLFIKAPGQSASRIDDSNVNSTDVTPTIADLLGITVPWETDGSPAGSEAVAARSEAKYVHSFTDAYDYQFLGVVDFDDEESYRKLLAGRFPAITADEDRLAGLYRGVAGSDLIGATANTTFGPESGQADIEALDRLENPPDDGAILGEIAGRVADAPPGATVVVAVNDQIIGVSPLYTRFGEENSFVVLLPGDALERTTNTIRIGVRDADGAVTERSVTGR